VSKLLSSCAFKIKLRRYSPDSHASADNLTVLFDVAMIVGAPVLGLARGVIQNKHLSDIKNKKLNRCIESAQLFDLEHLPRRYVML